MIERTTPAIPMSLKKNLKNSFPPVNFATVKNNDEGREINDNSNPIFSMVKCLNLIIMFQNLCILECCSIDKQYQHFPFSKILQDKQL